MMATKLVFSLVTTVVVSCAVCLCLSATVHAADTTAIAKPKVSRSAPAQKSSAKKAEQTKPTGSTSTIPGNSLTGNESRTRFHRESSHESSASQTRTAEKINNEEYQIDTRIFISGEAARKKGKTGFTQMTSEEKELAAFLGYRDYSLLKKSGQIIKKGKKYIVKFGKKKSVTITPLSESPDRVKLAIQWNIPGEEPQRWKKLLYFRRNHRSLIGGPHIEGGGMYLLSLEIQ